MRERASEIRRARTSRTTCTVVGLRTSSRRRRSAFDTAESFAGVSRLPLARRSWAALAKRAMSSLVRCCFCAAAVMSRCAALSAAADTPLSRAASSMACMPAWSPFAAASRAAASSRWLRSLLRRVRRVRSDAPASRSAAIASFADSSFGVTRRPLLRRASALATRRPTVDRAALAVEFLGELRDLRGRQQRILLRGFEQRLRTIEVLRGERRLDLRERGLRAHGVELARRLRPGAGRSGRCCARLRARPARCRSGARRARCGRARSAVRRGASGLRWLRHCFGFEHQHLAEMFERVVLGGLDVAALVHGEARLLEHFVERRDGSGRRRACPRRPARRSRPAPRRPGACRPIEPFHEVPGTARRPRARRPRCRR